MHDELNAIYSQHDGELPDLTKLERNEESPLTRMLVKAVIALAVIALVSWAGFLVWSGGIFQDDQMLQTSIDGPEEVRTGEEVFYTFRYENLTDTPIASLEMKVNLPLGFEITSASPEATEEQTWTIGSVTPGSDGSIVIGGTFRTEVPSSHSLQAFFTYRPANFNSDFQDIQTKVVRLSDSVITVALSGPDKALPGDEVTYVVNAQNTGRTEVRDVEIFLVLPNDFQILRSEPTLKEGGAPASWLFETLGPGELVAITFVGAFTSSAMGEQIVQADALLIGNQATRLAQSSSEFTTEILGGGVTFSLIADGSTQNTTADLGDRLRVSIDYTNSGEDVVEGFQLELRLETADGSAPIDWDEASLSGGTRSGSTIQWDETAVETFGTFAPGTTGVLDLTLPIKTELGTDADSFTLALTGSMEKIGNVESPRSVDASPIEIRINSDFRAESLARYYSTDGEALGSGPLPPRAENTTTYRIFWNLENSLHTLDGIVLSTNLPADVSWRDRSFADIGTLTYNDTTRVISWNIERLPDDAGDVEGWFDVAITPNASDAGSFFKLTNATSYFAKDPVSGGDISGALDLITTELPDDTYASGKGVVIE